jgi:hypothetical protein
MIKELRWTVGKYGNSSPGDLAQQLVSLPVTLSPLTGSYYSHQRLID